MDVSFQTVKYVLVFVSLTRCINTKLLKSCSESQKLLKVAKIEKKNIAQNRQKLFKSCRAQSVQAYPRAKHHFGLIFSCENLIDIGQCKYPSAGKANRGDILSQE